MKNSAIVAFVFAFTLLSVTPALAYLDPVSGSLLIQGVLAVLAAIMTFFGNFRKKIIKFFQLGLKKLKKNDDESG